MLDEVKYAWMSIPQMFTTRVNQYVGRVIATVEDVKRTYEFLLYVKGTKETTTNDTCRYTTRVDAHILRILRLGYLLILSIDSSVFYVLL